jgi:hypothetical protein
MAGTDPENSPAVRPDLPQVTKYPVLVLGQEQRAESAQTRAFFGR